MLFIWLIVAFVVVLGIVVIKQRSFIDEQDSIIIDLMDTLADVIEVSAPYLEADYQAAVDEEFEEIQERYYDM